MRIDIADDIEALRAWYAANSRYPNASFTASGAAWMLSRVSGIPQADIERAAGIGAAPSPVAPAMQMPAEPYPSQPLDVRTSVQPVGHYPGLGPITRVGSEPKEADLSRPVTPGGAFAVDLENGNRIVPLDGSFAERAERAIADGDPATRPVDAQTQAEVDFMFNQLRAQNDT